MLLFEEVLGSKKGGNSVYMGVMHKAKKINNKNKNYEI